MSNRLIQLGRIPLIPDPQVALKASEAFSVSSEQTKRVQILGTAYLELLLAIRKTFGGFANALEKAMRVRSLSGMSNQSLADIGIRRDQLAQIYRGQGFDGIIGQEQSEMSQHNER